MRLNHPDKRQLKRLFGDRAKFDLAERRLYARDVSNPPAPVKMMIKTMPDAVVFPVSEDELVELLLFANERGVALVPRGGGTAGYGGAMPVKGGIVVDMTRMAGHCQVAADGKTAAIAAGMTFLDAELHLQAHGKALRIMPTSAPSATVGGWFAQGGAGLGSLRYGWVHDVVERVRVVLPTGERRTFGGTELDVVADMEGMTGFITELTVRIRDDEPLVPLLATFADATALHNGVNALKARFPLYTMIVHDPQFNELRQEVTGQKNVPKNQFSVVMAFERQHMPAGGRADVQKVVEESGGKLQTDDKAALEWASRFGVFRAKRLGPSIVPGEAVVPTARLGESIARIHKAVRAGNWAMEGLVVGDDTVWFAFALDDERRKEYPAAFGASMAMLAAAKKTGGRSLGTGVYMSTEAGSIFSEDRIMRVKAFRRAVDPNGIMNPGKVFGAPIKFKPEAAPGPSVAQALKPGEPILKMIHGSSYVRYQRLDDARRPARSGISAALGAATGASFGRKWHWDSVVADLDTNIRSASASSRAFGNLAASPLGWARWIKEFLTTRAPVTPYQFAMVMGEGLACGADLASEMGIRYSEMFNDFKAHLIEQGFRPLPAHRRIADNIAAHHNQYGRPHGERTDWADGLDLTNKGDVLLFVDDTVSYQAPEVARNAEALLRRMGKRVAYLGADEWSSGAVLLHTGQVAAAKETIKHNIEAVKKAAVKEIVTPDAYAFHVFRNDYPRIAKELGLEWTVKVTFLHEYVARIIDESKAAKAAPSNVQVALHHPPVLTANGVTEDVVRKVLEWTGLTVVDMVHHGRYALDVGAAGAVPETYPEIGQKAARLVVDEAKATGATVLLSSDPASGLLLASAAAAAGLQTRPALPLDEPGAAPAQAAPAGEAGAPEQTTTA